MAISKIKDPARITTDPVLLSRLAKAGIDKDYVEFVQDYGRRAPGASPYSKRYKDHVSGRHFFVVKSLPMCRQDGTRLTPGWERGRKKHYARTNLFEGEVSDSGRIALSPTNDQPSGMLTSDTLAWQPQLFLGGAEVKPVSGPVLLETDPVNPHYQDNTLEWDYGICKRRIRTIEGRLFERWIFYQNPGSDVRIVHNHEGNWPPKLGEHQVSKDEELVPLAFFQQAEYPIVISATHTLYPDADPETSSADGYVERYNVNENWATIKAGAGTGGIDTPDFLDPIAVKSNTDPNWALLRRTIALFDASAASGSITSVSLSLYGTVKVDDCSIAPAVNVYSANPASNTEIVAADFTTLGTTTYCDTNITYANWSTAAGYNNVFDFNSTGRAVIQTAIDGAGIVKLGLRDALYDAGAGTPTHPGSSNLLTYMRCNSADKGSGYEPKLVIETNPDIDESLSVTIETEAAAQRKLILPVSVAIEPEVSLSRGLTFPLTSLVEVEAVGALHCGIVESLSVILEMEAAAGRLLQFPLSVLVEPEAEVTYRMGIEGSVSATLEMEAAAQKLLQFPLSVTVEPEAALALGLTKALSALVEVEVAGTKHLILFSKSDVLINIWTEESQVN